MNLAEKEKNLQFLGKSNIGRLVGAGIGEDGKYRLITGMGGRSDGSKNRYYQELIDLSGHGEFVRTAIHDMALQKGDPAMTIYTAHRQMRGWYVAGNGEQVDGICPVLAVTDPWGSEYGSDYFARAQFLYATEGPKADYTARITAAARADLFYMIMGRVERNTRNHARSVQRKWNVGIGRFELKPGEGFILTTYNGEGGTQPNYRDPMRIPMPGRLEDTMDLIWDAWDEKTKAGLCGKEIIDAEKFNYSFRSIHPGRA